MSTEHAAASAATAALPLKHHHGAMSVPDLNAAIAWYARVLGFALERRFPIPAIPAEVAMLRRGPMRIELFEVPGAAPLPPERLLPDSDNRTHGNKHVAFAVPDVDAAAAHLHAQQADVVWVKRFPWGANIFLRDPAGNLIELVEEPELWQAD
ncbi:VOC family protein [Pseudoxanthomonas sp.]|uniref:VOC family protein n=1 Tax=Pseudoxanthomonas sp. TaxID=1871049 RepID=UPI002611064E|nr:VOC family protein [Pseudoxanthomonas sp.]WDS35051.1 MAG: VOC family protein [Pseudoxanthomonas sp.]